MDRQQKSEPPVVTGLSPKDGIPGTQLTIRGENLGHSQSDLVGLTICGADCLLAARWESSRKIIARVNQPKAGVGDVIVTTRSGGRGTCTVQFRIFNVQIGPLQESAVWVDESRTVPALQREAANIANLVDDDPLGIANGKTRRFADSSMADMFPDGSSNIRLDNFTPVWFLMENYPNASFEDLKIGLANAQRHSSTVGREGPRDFLKTNLPSFVHCVDAMADLYAKLEVDKKEKGWPLGEKADKQVNECSLQASKLFADVLERKERGDSTRNALAVLQRFKFLFFLSSNIDKHLEKSDYALILNDYTRAKSLFADTEVPLFKEAYAQVEQRIANFRKTLEDKLVEMPSNLDEQKKIIRYLVLLKPDTDAGWTCLSASYHWLLGQLWDSQKEHHKAAVHAAHLYDADSDSEDKLASEISHRFYFVDSVAVIFSTKLQQFYKLGQAYVHGQLSSAPNLHKEDEIEGMVLNIIQLGVWLVLNAILPENVPADVSDQYKSRFITWSDDERNDTMHLLQSLKTFRSCVASLLQQDFGAKQLQPLYDLCITLRVNCLARVVEQSRQSVIDLQHRENWKIITREKDVSKTHSPELFERIVNEVLPLLKQITTNGGFPSETDLFANEKLRSTVLFHFERLFCSYKECLEKIARISQMIGASGQIQAVESSAASRRPTRLHLHNGTASGDSSFSLVKEVSSTPVPLKDRKVLIVLSNCDYALRFSLPQCIDRVKSVGAKFAEQLRERCIPKYGSLRTLLLKMYIAAKCAPFASLTEPPSVSDMPEKLEVSNSIKDLILCIVSVQAELFLISPQFSNQVMSFVVRNCSEQLLNNKSPPENLDIREANQILLDLTAFDESVQCYLSNDTKKILDDAKKLYVPHCDEVLIKEALERFRKRMRLTLLSLQDQNLINA